MSQKEFQRVKVIENAAGGRLLLDEICDLCQLRRIATGRRVLEILKARGARHAWDADAGRASGAGKSAGRRIADKNKLTNAAVCRWTCIVPFREGTPSRTDKVRIGRGLRWQLDLREG